jgi:hypothetical protein
MALPLDFPNFDDTLRPLAEQLGEFLIDFIYLLPPVRKVHRSGLSF